MIRFSLEETGMDRREIQKRLSEVRRRLLEIDVAWAILTKRRWLQLSRATCSLCKRHSLELLLFRKPTIDRNGRLRDTELFEIIDGFCSNCGSDALWDRLVRLEPERARIPRTVAPVLRTGLLCQRCLEADTIGIWRGGECSGAECQHCGWICLSPVPRRTRRTIIARFSAERRRARRELRDLEVLSQRSVLQRLFSLTKKDD